MVKICFLKQKKKIVLLTFYGRPSTEWLLCYITKSRLDVRFVKKIPLEIVIGQQMKEEGYDQN